MELLHLFCTESENGYEWVAKLGLMGCGQSEGVLIIYIYIFLCIFIDCNYLPIILSSGWICYAEKTHGSFIIPYISTTKSPQQIMGSLIKGHFAEQQVRCIEHKLIHFPVLFTLKIKDNLFLSCKLPAKAPSLSLL